jgi:hypothetical protein
MSRRRSLSVQYRKGRLRIIRILVSLGANLDAWGSAPPPRKVSVTIRTYNMVWFVLFLDPIDRPDASQ